MKKRRIWIVLLLLLAGSVLLAQDALTIYTSGNVGIGTDPQQDPGVPLKVQGKIQDRSGELMPVGSILAFGGYTPPAGWFLCNGDPQNISEYPDLYAVIGDYFTLPGTPTGKFGIPNLQGVSPTGVGLSAPMPITGNRKTGPDLGKLREDEMQSHVHKLTYSTSILDAGSQKGDCGRSGGGDSPYSTLPPQAPVRIGEFTHGPEIGVNFIIKY